jgi:molybdenum cofactor cytidylyltransferase
MLFEERAVSDAGGTILLRNIADASGERILKKGVRLREEHLAQLAAIGLVTVDVAILEADDVHEDGAALTLAEAMQTKEMFLSRPVGGRVNLRATADGLLQVDGERLLALNMLPGITLATRRQHTVVGPNQVTDNVGTLKIIPYAVHRRDLERAVSLAKARPGIVEVRTFPPDRRAALLLVGAPAVHDKLRDSFEPPTRSRLERLGAELIMVEGVAEEESAIAQAAVRLAERADLLIAAGQTSVMDEDDIILRALCRAGAEAVLSGAPVDPGNLLALAYLPGTPTGTPLMCAPGCAKGLKRNVVDLVLPRLLLGDHLTRRDIAALGLGGFLTPAERAGDII